MHSLKVKENQQKNSWCDKFIDINIHKTKKCFKMELITWPICYYVLLNAKLHRCYFLFLLWFFNEVFINLCVYDIFVVLLFMRPTVTDKTRITLYSIHLLPYFAIMWTKRSVNDINPLHWEITRDRVWYSFMDFYE